MSTTNEEESREYLRLAMVPGCAIDDCKMTPGLLVYLVAFCSYASKRNDSRCWVAQQKVADRMGVTRQSVSQAALKLAELGYMQVFGEWAGSETEGKTGRQLTNTYWINLNFVLPDDRLRSMQSRKRAGVGGMPYHKSRAISDSAHVAPATPEVAPPATPEVAPPATPGVAQNMESEYGKGKRKGKNAHAREATSISFNRWLQLPDSREARAFINGRPPRTSEQIVKYREWCEDNGLRATL